ncbi:hypothetical protein BDA99DRAFT_513548 [Phascolomyces articulosus]|uniref:Uncharacterized protein n=1 Tax=Phascolomyces articulosus TaxID=60185 RepID=A0AAD5PEI3_9FUNG|nr:hypothetical protein BDA99DRAFT_513548 [Phascolomyces articulosus]
MDEDLQPASATTRQLIGMPIMAFIHSEDLQILCGQLNMTYQRIQPTFDIRWLTNGCTSKQEEDYQWITVTGMPISFSAQSNNMLKQNAQITCVIEPIALLQEEEQERYHPQYQVIETIQGILVSLYNDLYEKATSGKIYVLEFLSHVLMNIIPLGIILRTNNHHNDENNDNNDGDDEEIDEYDRLQNNGNTKNEKRQQRIRRRQQRQQPNFIAVQKLDRIEIVPLVNKVQSSCKAVLDTYYYPIVKDILSVSNSIGSITQILPPAEVPLSTLESYIEWVTTAIRPTSSKQYY